MRKLIYIFIFIIIPYISLCQNVSSELTSNLLFWYPFNNNFLDYSGNENHATNYGTSDTSNLYSRDSRSVYFGTESTPIDSIKPGVPVYIADGLPWTFSAWVKMPAIYDSCHSPSYMTLFGNDTSHGHYSTIGINYGGAVTFTDDSGTLSPSWSYQEIPIYPIWADRWYHFVVTCDGDTLNLYMNSLKADTTLVPTNTNINVRFIGYHKIGVANYSLSALIVDDVRMYSKELTEQQVKILYRHAPY